MPRNRGDTTERVVFIAQPSPGGSSDQIRVSPAAPVRASAANRRRCGILVAREAPAFRLFALKQSFAAKAQLARASDDQVIVDGDSHHLGRGGDAGGHADVGLRRRRVARGVVVDHPF